MIRKLTAAIIVALLLLTLTIAIGVAQFGSADAPPLYTIEAEMVLPAGIDRSWQVLTDFKAYPEWNPYVPRAEGEFTKGGQLSFTIIDGNFAEPLDLTATFETIDPPDGFNWVGTLGMRGLHDTRHGFSLAAIDPNNTRLRHYEEFRGLLAWLMPGREERVRKTKAAFESMNAALRDRLTP